MLKPIYESSDHVDLTVEPADGNSTEHSHGANADSHSRGEKSVPLTIPSLQLSSPSGRQKGISSLGARGRPYDLQIVTHPPQLLRQGEHFVIRVKFFDEDGYEYDLKSAKFLRYDEFGNGIHFFVDVEEVGGMECTVKLFRCVTLGDGSLGPSDPLAITPPDLSKEEQYLWTYRDNMYAKLWMHYLQLRPGTYIPAATINKESNEAEFLVKCRLHSRAREFFQLQVAFDEEHVAFTSPFACYDVIPAEGSEN